MNKIVIMALCALTMTTATSCNSSLSEQEKTVKAEVKELKRQGWKVVGDENLTVVVSRHEEKKATEQYGEHIGFVEHCNSIDSGQEAARNDATKLIAELTTQSLKDDCDPSLLGDPKLDTFYANFESIFVEKLAAELAHSFYLYKKSDTEDYTVTGYFLINNVQAANIVLNALKEAEGRTGITFMRKSDAPTEHVANQ